MTILRTATNPSFFDGWLDDNNMKDVTTEMIPFGLSRPCAFALNRERERREGAKNEKRSLCRCRVYNTTVDSVISNAESEGWAVHKVYDFWKSILDAGSGDVGRIKVIGMCQPEYASGLLGADDTKFVAVMMPCAVAVYGKLDGGTYVASMNIGIRGTVFGGAVDQTILEFAE